MQCEGEGKYWAEEETIQCRSCFGTGYHDVKPKPSPPSEREECGRCRGYGTIGGVTCSFCGGQGYWHVSN